MNKKFIWYLVKRFKWQIIIPISMFFHTIIVASFLIWLSNVIVEPNQPGRVGYAEYFGGFIISTFIHCLYYLINQSIANIDIISRWWIGVKNDFNKEGK